MALTTKKIQIYPMGDKEEVNRVYEYLRSGIYNQYMLLNVYMGQVASLFYSVNMDMESEIFHKGFEQIFEESKEAVEKMQYKQLGNYIHNLQDAYKKSDKNLGSDEYKENYNKIFRNSNRNIDFVKQAKGLGMAGNCGMRVKSDFSTAIKNGLARGERRIPFYKSDFPLIAPNRFLNFYIGKEEYQDDDGNMKERDIYAIKFVNKIHFKVILGSKGKRDFYLVSLLDSIINDPDHYSVRDSSIQLTNKGKIILNLSVRVDKEKEKYEPEKGKTMGLAMGYDKCLVAALSNDDTLYTIGDDIQESIVDKRIAIQNRNRTLQIALKEAKGGHGRKRKVTHTQERQKAYEKNVVKNYNHELSKRVVEFAKNNKVEAIIIEDIEKEDLKHLPVLLRNWSYYQLEQFITYKATTLGIKVVKSTGKAETRTCCCKCGCQLSKEKILPKEFEWCHEISFICSDCGKQVDYSYNKAKNIIAMG